MAQAINPDDVVAVADDSSRLNSDASQSRPTSKPPGLVHSALRAYDSTMANLDQLMSNVAGIAAKLPNTPNFKAFSESAAREAQKRRDALERDTQQGGAPQTILEKGTEGTLNAVGSSIPYLTAEGPIAAGVVGALENADQGFVPAIESGIKTAVFHKAGSKLSSKVSKGIEKVPVLKDASATTRRAVAGGVTAGTLAKVASIGSGQDSNAGGAAIAGAIGGATQRPPRTENEIRAAKLQAATGKTAKNAWQSYRVVGPRLAETARAAGMNPKSVEDLAGEASPHGKPGLVQLTLDNLEKEYKGYLDPIRSQTTAGTPIADAIENSITEAERNGKTAAEKKLGDALQKRADEFRQSFTLGELDDLRKAYFENRTGKSSEQLEARSSADVRADRIAEEAIKDVLYPLVDVQAQAQGKRAGHVRETLKAEQANLIQLKDALMKRRDTLAEKEGIRQGTPITQRSNVTLAAHPGGGIVGSIHGLMNMIFGDPDSAKEANKRVSEGFNARTKRPPSHAAAVVAGQASKMDRSGKKEEKSEPTDPTKQYVVGGIYGGLEYLGGDVKNQASWRKVQ